MTIILQITNIGVSYQNRNFSQINGQPVVSYLIDRLKAIQDAKLLLPHQIRRKIMYLSRLQIRNRWRYSGAIIKMCLKESVERLNRLDVRILSEYLPIIR